MKSSSSSQHNTTQTKQNITKTKTMMITINKRMQTSIHNVEKYDSHSHLQVKTKTRTDLFRLIDG